MCSLKDQLIGECIIIAFMAIVVGYYLFWALKEELKNKHHE